MSIKALIRRAKETPPKEAIVEGTAEGPEEALVLGPRPPPQAAAALRSVRLAEDWLPEEAEAILLRNLRRRRADFQMLRTKRTARYGGDPGPPFLPEVLPPWLQELCLAVGDAAALEPTPNHVLVNHYQPGQGILPHTDGPAYSPWAAIVSLGSAVVFDFWRDHAHVAGGEAPVASLLVPPRSLLVFSDEAYKQHLHGISDRLADDLQGLDNWSPDATPRGSWAVRQLRGDGSLQREERYSLTIRHPRCWSTRLVGRMSMHTTQDWVQHAQFNMYQAQSTHRKAHDQQERSAKAHSEVMSDNMGMYGELHTSLDHKVKTSQRLLDKLTHRAQSVENSLQHTRATLHKLEEALAAKEGSGSYKISFREAPLALCMWRMEQRERRPLREQVRDTVEVCLEVEKATLMDAQRKLKDSIKKTRATIAALESKLDELRHDIQQKTQALSVRPDQLARTCRLPLTRDVGLQGRRVHATRCPGADPATLQGPFCALQGPCPGAEYCGYITCGKHCTRRPISSVGEAEAEGQAKHPGSTPRPSSIIASPKAAARVLCSDALQWRSERARVPPHQRPIFLVGENGTDAKDCVDVHNPRRFSSTERTFAQRGLRFASQEEMIPGQRPRSVSSSASSASRPVSAAAFRAKVPSGELPPVPWCPDMDE
eukprot:s42_g20.t1